MSSPRPLMILLLLALGCAPRPSVAVPEFIQIQTSDEVQLHGYPVFGELGLDAPLVFLFHMAGSDARSEYATLAPWLNELGYRTILWDLRAGGKRLGGVNLTAQNLSEEVPNGYCQSYPDFEAIMEWAGMHELGAKSVILWGSSYSAALIFRVAMDFPEQTRALVASSPAGGGPMVDCRPRLWLHLLSSPALALRPSSEMKISSSQEQRVLMEAAGVEFMIVEGGRHGSLMLADEEDGRSRENERKLVADWLADIPAGESD